MDVRAGRRGAPPWGDPQLGEDPVQVGGHRSRRQVHFRADFLVGEPRRGELGDLELLRSERRRPVSIGSVAFLAGGLQFGVGAQPKVRRPGS